MPAAGVQRICAVIVAYKPDLSRLAALFAALRGQVAEQVLVINGPLDSDLLAAIEQRGTGHGVHCHCNDQNLGLAVAQNQGIFQARALGCDAVLLLDQDSRPADDMVKELLAVFRDRTAAGDRPAAVAPRYQSEADDQGHWPGFVRIGTWGFGRAPCAHGAEWVEADFVIASGCLIPLAVLDDVGDMDAGLFIDHIDTEWCLRARDRGYRLFGVCRATMAHELGEKRIRVWFGRRRLVAAHQPLRYYYMFRNSMLLYRRDYIRSAWKWGDFLRSLQLLVFFGVISARSWADSGHDAAWLARRPSRTLRGICGALDASAACCRSWPITCCRLRGI
jgi:rhamnosyltransferase